MNNIEEDFALILTATVLPAPGLAALTRSSATIREADYLSAFDYYLHNHPRIRNLVFVENSGWPLDKFKRAASLNPLGKRVEIVSLSINDFPPARGKSYGELSLLKHGVAASEVLSKTKYVAKVTGRLILRNITDIVERLPVEFDLACDLRDHPLYEIMGLHARGRYSDTRFLIFHRDYFLSHIDEGLEWVDDSQKRLVEYWVYDLAKAEENKKVVKRFPVEPRFSGVSGALNRPYGSGVDRAKTLFRALARRIIPWLHI